MTCVVAMETSPLRAEESPIFNDKITTQCSTKSTQINTNSHSKICILHITIIILDRSLRRQSTIKLTSLTLERQYETRSQATKRKEEVMKTIKAKETAIVDGREAPRNSAAVGIHKQQKHGCDGLSDARNSESFHWFRGYLS